MVKVINQYKHRSKYWKNWKARILGQLCSRTSSSKGTM